jgi:hypothetical protein
MCARIRLAASCVSAPGADGSAAPSIVRTGMDLAQRRGHERLAHAAPGRRGRDLLGHLDDAEQMAARDRVEDVLGERRRDERLAVQRADEGGRRALEHAPVRGHEQRVVGALLLAEAAREHVGAVGQRLDLVEHARGAYSIVASASVSGSGLSSSTTPAGARRA